MEKLVVDWKSNIKGVVLGILIGTAFGLAGFIFVRIPGSGAMGAVMFFLVPFAAGFGIAMVTPLRTAMIISAWVSLLASLAILVVMRFEGVLCAVLAFPILAASISVGAILGELFRNATEKFGKADLTLRSVILVVMPLMVYGGHRVEMVTLTHPRQETVTSTIRLDVPPEQVWPNLHTIDTVAGRKSLLMYFGLPIPVRCVTNGTAAGAKRTCYFDHGYIEETVLEWSPPSHMRLSIDRTNMPGRHWLRFEGAEYDLRRDGYATELTRTTTITSNLYPVWYWRPFERWGVASEHEYLFSDLARRFAPSAAQSR